MQPYRRVKKPIRRTDICGLGKWLGKVSKATGSILLDLKSVWYRDPSLPASVRIILSLLLLAVLILPFLFFLFPPAFLVLTIKILRGEDFTSWLTLPDFPLQKKKLVYQICKTLIRKLTFRVSMLVTFYDYVQMFRGMGLFNVG